MKTPSFTNERTYTVDTWQVFFGDEYELVVKAGCAVPASTGDGIDYEIDWQTETPPWADDMTDDELINFIGLGMLPSDKRGRDA